MIMVLVLDGSLKYIAHLWSEKNDTKNTEILKITVNVKITQIKFPPQVQLP